MFEYLEDAEKVFNNIVEEERKIANDKEWVIEYDDNRNFEAYESGYYAHNHICVNLFQIEIENSTRNKIDFSKPLMVASVDFEDSSIISMDKIYHSFKELINWLFAIKMEVNKPFDVTLREFTIKEEDNLTYEDEIWEFEWDNFFESKVIETFKM